MSEIDVRSKLRCWGKMSMIQTRKIGLQRIQLLGSHFLEMVKNQFRLLNRSILMSELGVRPKLRFLAQMSSKQTQKILLARNSASELTNPLEMVKKTCQASESLNYDVGARS